MIRLILSIGLFFSSLTALPTPALAQYGGMPTMQCASFNYQTTRCNVRLYGGGAAFLQRQIGGQCGPLGTNWGWDENGVWVRNGCQGLFAIKYPPGGGGNGDGPNPGYGYGGNGGGYAPPPPPAGRIVRCESMNYRPARCAVDVYGPPVIQQVLWGPCIQGQSWSWDRGGINVSSGCRANFLLPVRPNFGGGYPGGGIGNGAGIGGGMGGGMPGSGQVITCSSWNFQPARCAAFTRNGITLLSVNGGECIRNRTWGWDGNGIWVNNGCRARFQIN